MIQLIQGPPRSGKSYFAVNYLLKFVEFDELYQEYTVRPDVLIISNIEGLRIRHWSLSKCLEGRTLEDFFSIENFEKIQEKTRKTHIVLCVDEAHELFPSGFRSEKIYNFFAYHGHIGLDVILMTQGIESMSRLFNPLLEYIVCVTQRSKSVTGAFSYTYRDLKGRYLFSKVLRKSADVFRAYKSFRQDEHNKPKNALLRWAVIVIAFFVVGIIVFNSALGTLKDKSEQARVTSSTEKPSKRVVSPAVSASSSRVSADFVLPVPEAIGSSWRSYPVEGVVKTADGHIFLIHGRRVVESRRTRNYDPELGIVEFYGPEIPAAPLATARQAAGISGEPGTPAKATALAVASDPHPPALDFPSPQ